MADNRLYCGDNLAVLRRYVADEVVDLVYLDPPFNSQAVYSVTCAGQGDDPSARVKAFDDVWVWDQATAAGYAELVRAAGPLAEALQALRQLVGVGPLLAYLTMLAPRLVELRRVLRPTGALYLHCDPTASHYLKALLDVLLGQANFRNELIWHYGGRGAKAIAHRFPRNHDVLLYYARDARRHAFHRQSLQRPLSHAEARRRGYQQDETGQWFKTAPRGDYTDDSLARLAQEGRIYRTRSGALRIKYPLEATPEQVLEETLVGDVWTDIPDAMHLGHERRGYPTQKPEALLERILRASSAEGDLVLDPFCGCGTTVVVAQRLGRRWIGIDSAPVAIAFTEQRLQDAFGGNVAYDVVRHE